MQLCYIVFAVFAARYFVPMTIFMTPYLIEKKKFTNKEIFNVITPFFFLASLFASIFGPMLMSWFGSKWTLCMNSALELVCYAIFYFMLPRSFACAIAAGFIHGLVSALTTQSKPILFENRPDYIQKKTMLLIYIFIKKSCGVVSSWLGQDLKYATGNHQSSLMVSAFTMSLSLVLCVFIRDPKGKEKEDFAKILFSGAAFERIGRIYTRDILYFSCLNIIGSSLYIAFALYSASMFIERKKDVDPSVFMFGKALHMISAPIRRVARAIIYLTSMIDGSIIYAPSYDKNTIIFGYIDGLAKLVSVISSTFLNLVWSGTEYLHAKCFVATVLVMFFTYLIGTTNNLMTSYIVYILGALASQTSSVWSYDGLLIDTSVLHIILGMNLMIGSIIHILISYFTKMRNYSVSKKMQLYFWVNTLLLGSAVLIKTV